MSLGTIEDLGDVSGRTVLVRSDLNVPLRDASGPEEGSGKVITDDGRIRASVPTIRALTDRGARVVVMAHLGRPKGAPDPAFSLAPVAERLGSLLGSRVAFSVETVGKTATSVVQSLADGEVAVLENVRFDPRETSKDNAERGGFADELAELGDVFVSDGFGVVHRKQASVYDLAQRLPHAAGGLVTDEVSVLQRLTESPERPYVVVLGGAKVSDKLGVIENLLDKADQLLIGGGMVFTFLAARGYPVGNSLLEQDQIETVRDYLERAGDRIVLPKDVVVAAEVSAEAESGIVSADGIEADMVGVDIGPSSVGLFAGAIAGARTVFWNGPMGVFEIPSFANGTRGVAEALVEVHGLSVVGGGDSAAAVRTLGFDEKAFGHISTGGGASLEYLEGKTLPGLQVLED